jgi:drug/metabolite transporter (DMT)-like permease
MIMAGQTVSAYEERRSEAPQPPTLCESKAMLANFSRFGGHRAAPGLRGASFAGSSVALGVGFAVLSFLLFSSMDMMIKRLTSDYPVQQMLFLNALFALAPISFAIWLAGGAARLKTRRPFTHLMRGCTGMAASFASMLAFSMMPMADVYAFLFATPLLVTALSVPLLGERVGWRRWSAIAVGFAGVMIMLQPGHDATSVGATGIGAVAALAAAFSASLSVILVRKLSATDSTGSIALYANVVVALGMGAWALQDYRPMPNEDLALAASAGVAGGCALLALIGAYRRAAAAIVAPFQYSQMIWGVIFGYWMFGDAPSASALAGGAIVIASGLFILRREVALASSAAATAPPTPAAAAPLKAA